MPELTIRRTIRRDGEREIEVSRSRFVCALARVPDEAAARAFIADVRRRRWDARHHCTAYIVGDPPHERSADDGEPAGTAGVPMLQVLRRRGLTDTVAVVSRYFGGVLLGAGGLLRAYSAAVAGAVDEVGVLRLRPVALVTVTVGHGQAGALEHRLRSAGRPPRDVRYGPDGASLELALPAEDLAALEALVADATGGRVVPRRTGTATFEEQEEGPG